MSVTAITRSSTGADGVLAPRRRFSVRRDRFSVALSIPEGVDGGVISGLPFRPFSRAISSRNDAFSDASRAFSSNSPSVSGLSTNGEKASTLSGGLAMPHRITKWRETQPNVSPAHWPPGLLPQLRGGYA